MVIWTLCIARILSTMHTVAATLYPQALATSITLPMEILQAASQMARASARQAGSGVRFLLAGQDVAPVTLGSGVVLQPESTPADLPPLDLLLLPAIWRCRASDTNCRIDTVPKRKCTLR